MKIYLASSWRNERYSDILSWLRLEGHEVYDFKNPESSFSWSQVMPEHQNNEPVPAHVMVGALNHPLAVAGFSQDMEALAAADAVILVLPCGRSAHLELGWAVAAGKPTCVLLEEPCTPELMYSMVNRLTVSENDALDWASRVSSMLGKRAALQREIAYVEGELT